MVGNLLSSGRLIGRNRDEVIELLGTPDRECPRELEYDYVHGDLLADWVNMPFSNWREWVWIGFDEAGVVRQFETRD